MRRFLLASLFSTVPALALTVAACGGSTVDTGTDDDSGAPDSGFADTKSDSIASDTHVDAPSDSSPGDSTSGDTGATDSGTIDSGTIDTSPGDGILIDAPIDGTPLDVGPDTAPTDAGPSPCPTTAPTDGTACSPDGLECTYGADPRPSCRIDAVCHGDPSGTLRWSVTGPGPTCGSTPPACPSPLTPGDTCTSHGEVCPDGDQECVCGCPPPLFCTTDKWNCSSRPTGCPTSPPDLGSSCSAPPPSTVCDYGQCSGGFAASCKDGLWTRVAVACPG